MRRLMLATVLALILTTWPPIPAGAEGERVIIDANIMAVPPNESAPCMRLDAGQLSVQLRNTGEPPWGGARTELRRTVFEFAGYRGSDPGGRIEVLVGERDSTITVPIAGGLYCWWFEIDAPVTMDTSMAGRTNYSQFIAIRMTLTP